MQETLHAFTAPRSLKEITQEYTYMYNFELHRCRCSFLLFVQHTQEKVFPVSSGTPSSRPPEGLFGTACVPTIGFAIAFDQTLWFPGKITISFLGVWVGCTQPSQKALWPGDQAHPWDLPQNSFKSIQFSSMSPSFQTLFWTWIPAQPIPGSGSVRFAMLWLANNKETLRSE